ncbi:ferrous iron transport protein A [Dysgonomonas sp. HDW5A]|nr:ferrous iron transport protein A [Dysgonomonas sp. HDW5A]
METRLSELIYGEKAKIVGIEESCKGEIRRRLLDLGFVRGTIITVQNISPLSNPVAYSLRNTLIALRNEQAQCILIKKLTDNDKRL